MIGIIRYIVYQKDIFFLIFVLLFSTTIFLSNDSDPVKKLKNNFTNYYTSILGPFFWYKSAFDLKEKNASLNEKITRLELEQNQLNSLSIENKKLKEMLDYKQKNNLVLKLGEITSHNMSPTINSFSINIGKNNNLESNLPVIDMNGIIGKIFSVHNNKSVIQIVTDKNFRVSIRIGSNRTLGIFVPTHSKYGIIEGVPKSQKVEIDDIAVTSGISDIYPPNIPVAKVISSYIDNNQFFQNITVEILADVYNPDFVFVIK